jgi:hypothetical protein
MAEYESIHGTRVKYLSSDPTLDSSTEGQVWYNSTSGVNKSLVQLKLGLPVVFYQHLQATMGLLLKELKQHL